MFVFGTAKRKCSQCYVSHLVQSRISSVGVIGRLDFELTLIQQKRAKVKQLRPSNKQLEGYFQDNNG